MEEAAHRPPRRRSLHAPRRRARGVAEAPRGIVAPRPRAIHARAPSLSPLRMTPLAPLFTLAFPVSVDARRLGPVLPFIAASPGAPPGSIGLAMLAIAGIGLALVGAATAGVRFGSPR